MTPRRFVTMVLLSAHVCVHAAPIRTGVEEILWPAVIVATPFFLVRDVLFGSDSSAMKSTARDAQKILDAQRTPIPINGLYTGALNLRWALYGMLVEARLPFIEVDTAGSKWLLELADDPKQLIERAVNSKYLRLSLGTQGEANCFGWKNFSDDWLRQPPVRPGSCMRLEVTDHLESDVQLQVDPSQVSRRQLSWVLVDRASGQVHLSVPFWQSQTKGQPLSVSVVYRAAHETGSFISVLSKLAPSATPTNTDGLPFVMNQIPVDLHKEGQLSFMRISGLVRTPLLDWDAVQTDRATKSWHESYAHAHATGQPQIVGKLVIVPQSDSVGSSCALPYGKCDFTRSYASDLGVMTTHYSPAYQDQDKSRNPHGIGHDMHVVVGARGFDGRMKWVISITPWTLPESHAGCKDRIRGCYFDPSNFAMTSNELVIRGKFRDGAQAGQGSAEYELVVSRDQLPATQPLP